MDRPQGLFYWCEKEIYMSDWSQTKAGSEAPASPGDQARNIMAEAQRAGQHVGIVISERVVGGERLEGFSLKEFFSGVFQRRTDEDTEELFITGTRNTTPPLNQIETDWPKPWAFFRVLLVALLVFLGFQAGLNQFGLEGLNLIPGYIIVGSFAVPFAGLIFFMEMNAPRNISFYQILKLVFLGGTASLLIALQLFKTTQLGGTWLGASSAGIIEETGKLLAVMLFMGRSRYRWTLNGLLFGAAVGTGFAAFESAGYALQSLLGGILQGAKFPAILEAVQHNIVLRGALAPGGHIVWTALASAALWRAKGDGPLNLETLKNPRFLSVFGFVVVLHALWNAPFGLPIVAAFGIPADIAKCVVLSLIAWIAALTMIQSGRKQIHQAQQAASAKSDSVL
jgi:RsiW-degrading membrane proteinase PrsW (M82 family)